MTDAWVRVQPARADRALPLLCDSPHSGTRYPEDFGAALPLHELRRGEDTHVDRLWERAPDLGATLVAAEFPRTYIDPNRALGDLDAGMLDGPWPGPLQPSPKAALGFGLVWRQVRAGTPVYARPLPVAEVQRRIATCWQPYHDAVQQAAQAALQRWGALWHLNLHSMPHDAYQRLGIDSPTPLADFVLGDLHGRSCEAGFTRAVMEALERQGFRVTVNDPYEGQELVRLVGAPHEQRHSLQVEIHRGLYMNEATREPLPQFDALQATLGRVLEEVAGYVRQRVQA